MQVNLEIASEPIQKHLIFFPAWIENLFATFCNILVNFFAKSPSSSSLTCWALSLPPAAPSQTHIIFANQQIVNQAGLTSRVWNKILAQDENKLICPSVLLCNKSTSYEVLYLFANGKIYAKTIKLGYQSLFESFLDFANHVATKWRCVLYLQICLHILKIKI